MYLAASSNRRYCSFSLSPFWCSQYQVFPSFFPLLFSFSLLSPLSPLSSLSSLLSPLSSLSHSSPSLSLSFSGFCSFFTQSRWNHVAMALACGERTFLLEALQETGVGLNEFCFSLFHFILFYFISFYLFLFIIFFSFSVFGLSLSYY